MSLTRPHGIYKFQAALDLADDDLAQDDLDELEQDEALLREIEELQLVSRWDWIVLRRLSFSTPYLFLSSINI